MRKTLNGISVEVLSDVISRSGTVKVALSELGFSTTSSNRRRFMARAKELGLDVDHLLAARTRRSKIWDVSVENFKKILETSTSIGGALAQFGLRNVGGNYITLKNRAATLNIDMGPLYERSRNYQKTFLAKGFPREATPEDMFVKGTYRNGSTLKRALHRQGILPNTCQECGIPPVWNGKPFSMQLDHINGDRTDNRLENLRFLCPICHAQTDTYCGKNLKHTREGDSGLLPKILRLATCTECGQPKGSTTTGFVCVKCSNRKKAKYPNPPDKEVICPMVRKIGFVQTGKAFGVSYNTIRKWLRKQGVSVAGLSPFSTTSN